MSTESLGPFEVILSVIASFLFIIMAVVRLWQTFGGSNQPDDGDVSDTGDAIDDLAKSAAAGAGLAGASARLENKRKEPPMDGSRAHHRPSVRKIFFRSLFFGLICFVFHLVLLRVTYILYQAYYIGPQYYAEPILANCYPVLVPIVAGLTYIAVGFIKQLLLRCFAFLCSILFFSILFLYDLAPPNVMSYTILLAFGKSIIFYLFERSK